MLDMEPPLQIILAAVVAAQEALALMAPLALVAATGALALLMAALITLVAVAAAEPQLAELAVLGSEAMGRLEELLHLALSILGAAVAAFILLILPLAQAVPVSLSFNIQLKEAHLSYSIPQPR